MIQQWPIIKKIYAKLMRRSGLPIRTKFPQLPLKIS